MRRNVRDTLASVARMRERRRLYALEEQHLAEVLGHAAAAVLVPVVPQQREALPVRSLAG